MSMLSMLGLSDPSGSPGKQCGGTSNHQAHPNLSTQKDHQQKWVWGILLEVAAVQGVQGTGQAVWAVRLAGQLVSGQI